MEQKSAIYYNRGMLRDTSISNADKEHVFENRNIRLIPTGNESTLLSVSNERGTKQISLDNTIKGRTIGYCTLGNYLTLFTIKDSIDYIYRIDLSTEPCHVKEIYHGDLGFSFDWPIETLGYYENEKIQKVYWVDGINLPRVVNINKEEDYSVNPDSTTQFNFIETVNVLPNVSIEKNISGGKFPSGIIQYFISYYNKYGQETNIIYRSPLYYLTDSSKGASPEALVTNSFVLKIYNVDTRFDYLRIYSLIRTSLNTVASCNIVTDIYIKDLKDNTPVIYTDTGSYINSIDPAALLFIGGRDIIPYTICQKDNTLFLGNLKYKSSLIDSDIKKELDEVRETDSGLKFIYSSEYTEKDYSIPYYAPTGLYPYNTQLNSSGENVQIFKGGNTYRIGFVIYSETMSPSSVYWIGDIKNNLYPVIEASSIDRAIIRYDIPDALKKVLSSKGKYISLVMAETSSNDRSVLAQGVLSPTVFNMRERYSGSIFSKSSWFFRPIKGNKEYSLYNPLKIIKPMSSLTTGSEISYMTNTDVSIINDYYEDEDLDQDIGVYICATSETWKSNGTIFASKRGNLKSWEVRVSKQLPSDSILHLDPLNQNPDNDLYLHEAYDTGSLESAADASRSLDSYYNNRGYMNRPSANSLYNLRQGTSTGNARILLTTGTLKNLFGKDQIDPDALGAYDLPVNELWYSPLGATTLRKKEETVNKWGQYFFVDSSIATFNSPEIREEEVFPQGYKLRVIGIASITGVSSAFSVDIEPDELGQTIISPYGFSSENLSENPEGLCAFSLVNADFLESESEIGNNYGYWLFPWHKSGSISEVQKPDSDEKYSVLNHKYLSNSFYSYYTRYFINYKDSSGNNLCTWEPEKVNFKYIGYGQPGSLYTYIQNGANYIYESSCDTTYSVAAESEYPLYYNAQTSVLTSKEALLNGGQFTSKTYGNPVTISYKTSPHLLVSFDDKILTVTQNGNTTNPNCVIGLPEYTAAAKSNVINEDNGLTIWNGQRIWDEDAPIDISNAFNIYTKSNTSASDYTIYIEGTLNDNNLIFEDNWDIWKSITIDESNPVYCIVRNDNNFSLRQITAINREIESLSEVIINSAVFDSSTKELSVSWITSDGADLYTAGYVDSEGLEHEIETVSTSYIQHSVETDNITQVYVIAKDSTGWYNDSSKVFADVAVKTPEETQSTIDVQAIEPSVKIILKPDALIKLTLSESEPTIENPEDVLVKNQSNATYYRINLETGASISRISTDQVYGYSEQISITTDTGLDSTTASEYLKYPYLLLAEVYKEDINLYGGNNEAALEQNTFIPIGDIQYLSRVLQEGYIMGYNGDSYFQRWDCIKTEPVGGEEARINNVTEMLSFMVESYRNLDGRYDSRRGLVDNNSTTYESISDLNEVYSQNNNYNTFSYLSDKFSLTDYPNQFTWSLTKNPTESIDSWTKITLANIYNMDGDKGKISALRRFNNSIIAFQDKAVAEVLYNTRTQLSTIQGVPIEIANSSKVDGVRYISNTDGCLNKWSIVETQRALYFIDNINTSISVVANEGIQSISTPRGFRTFLSEVNSSLIWNARDYVNTISFYDRINDEIYFVYKDYALCFSEQLNEFTSFFDYSSLPVMTAVNDSLIAVNNDEENNSALWRLHKGEYNMFFGTPKPYWTIYRMTPDPIGDKIYSILEYRSDMFDMNQSPDSVPQGVSIEDTFNHLDIWNEYQKTSVKDLVFKKKDIYADVRRKFRIWRMDIPRAMKSESNKYGLDRIRSPWIYVKLTKDNNLEDNTRLQLYDLTLKYFE